MARDPILGMFASRKRPGLALATLKTQRTYAQTRALLEADRIYGIRKQVTDPAYVENWRGIPAFAKLPRSRSLVQEVGWIAHSLIFNAGIIRSFIESSANFNARFLLGDYTGAREVLDAAEARHGKSIWLAERRMMLLQAHYGFDEHKAYLTAIQSEGCVPFIAYVLSMVSNRLEPHVTPESFHNLVKDPISRLRSRGDREFSQVLEFLVDPWSNSWKENAHAVVHFCCGKPVVDSFNFITKLLLYLDRGSIPDSEIKHLATIVSDLEAAAIDPVFTRIKAWLCPDVRIDIASDSNPELLSAVEHFWSGNFIGSISATSEILRALPTVFPAYWLLARAAACIPEQPEIPFAPKSFAYSITRSLSEIATNQLAIEVFLIDLQAIALKLGDIPLGIELWQFSERENSGSIQREALRYSRLRAGGADPEDFRQGGRDYATTIYELDAFAKRPILSFLVGAVDAPGGPLRSGILHPAFAAIALAELDIQAGKFSDALSVLSQPLDTQHGLALRRFLAGGLAQLEFSALTGLRHFADAASAVVRNYVANRNSLRHVAFELLIAAARDGRCSELKGSPYLPALVFLNNGDEQDIYESLDDYFIANGWSGPREFINCIDSIQADVARVLLRDVLILPVLARGALWANTPNEQREIRTEALRRLFSKSVEDQAFVVSELSEIEHLRLLEQAYTNVEGPKFSADFADHNRMLCSLLEGSFERYASYRAYEEKGGQVADEARLLEKATTSASPSKEPDKKTETSEVLLSNLVFTILAEYVWDSRKGVNATLSTRIRHGSLENQLMRIFDAHQLLATKDLAGEYHCHKAVINALETCSDEQREAAEKAIVEFTRELNAVYSALLSLLRIRVSQSILSVFREEGTVKELASDDGLLDMREAFSDAATAKIRHANPRTIAALVAEVQKMFEEYFGRALAGAREYIGVSVAKQIGAAVDRLDSSIYQSLPDRWERVALRRHIMAVKDGFPNELRIIQTWLSFAKRIDSGAGSMRQLFETAARVVNFASNGRLGSVETDEVDDLTIKPEEGVVLYEVISILLRNIVQHAHFGQGQVVRFGFSAQPNGERIIRVSNMTSSAGHCEEAVKVACVRLAGPGDPRVLDRSPGGTGLRRIQALLKQVSNRPILVEPQVGETREQFTVLLRY